MEAVGTELLQEHTCMQPSQDHRGGEQLRWVEHDGINKTLHLKGRHPSGRPPLCDQCQEEESRSPTFPGGPKYSHGREI